MAPSRSSSHRILHGPRGASSAGQLPLVLGVVALLLGGAALGVAVTTHAQTGPTGAAGPSGNPGIPGAKGDPGTPGINGTNGVNGTNGANGTNGSAGAPGPGATVNQSYGVSDTRLFSEECGYANHSTLGFTVDGPGTLIVTASVVLQLYHLVGTYTSYELGIAATPSACSEFPGGAVSGGIGPTEPNGTYSPDVSLVQGFTISAAGGYTVEIVGEVDMNSVSDTSEFLSISEVGVFYPA
jgi:hypothetical protein